MSPNSSRLSQNGTLPPSVPPRWNSGTSSTPVAQNGSTAMAWWWHTEFTSGRAL